MRNKRTKGFTLIEVLIAVAIIVILTLIVTPNLISKVADSKKRVDIANAKAIATAAKTELLNGTAPGSVTLDTLEDTYFNGTLPKPQSDSSSSFTLELTTDNKVIVKLGSTTLYP